MTRAKARVGIACIGAGSIAEYHLAPLVFGLPGADVRILASRTLAKAHLLARRFGGPAITDSIPFALAREDVDAVIVATPDDAHEEFAVAALRAGKHVLVQKPMATSAVACRRMIEVAHRSGRDLQVSFMHRYFEEVEAARALLADGIIGKVTTVRIRNATPGPDWSDWFFQRERVSGGVVFQLGIHGIDLVGYLIGPIEAVSARTATLLPERRLADGRVVHVENPDTAIAVYEAAGGSLVHHEMSMIEPHGTDRFRMEIYGTEGAIWLRSELGPLAIRRNNQSDWETPPLRPMPLGVRHHLLWIDGLLGRAPALDTAQAGLAGLLVAEAIATSAEAGGARTLVQAA